MFCSVFEVERDNGYKAGFCFPSFCEDLKIHLVIFSTPSSPVL
jgi:hypothetical protein